MRPQAPSGRGDTEASDKRLGNDKLVINDFQWKCGQAARGRSIDDRCALARIVPGIVTGAFEDLLFLYPTADFAARMRTDRRIGDHPVGRTFPRSADERCGIETNQ